MGRVWGNLVTICDMSLYTDIDNTFGVHQYIDTSEMIIKLGGA